MDNIMPIEKDLFEPILKHIVDINLSKDTGQSHIVVSIPDNLSLNVDSILSYFEEDVSALYNRNGKNYLAGVIKSKALSKWLIENVRYA